MRCDNSCEYADNIARVLAVVSPTIRLAHVGGTTLVLRGDWFEDEDALGVAKQVD